MSFQIGRATFAVEKARLTGKLSPDGNLRWELQVHGEDRKIGGETWYPWACIQDIPLPSPADGRWQTCFPFSSRWIKDTEEGDAMISIGQSCFGVYSGALHITAPNEQGIMDLEWSGFADLGVNEEFDFRVPIKIRAPLKFMGINGGEWSLEEAEVQLKRAFPRNSLRAVSDDAVNPLVHFELL
jgi:hypothetical protein